MAATVWNYKHTNMVKEDHNYPLYCIAFNFFSTQHEDVFGSVGGNRATVYKCSPGGGIDILQAYVDDNKAEEYFACKWSVDQATGAPLLLVAGKLGLLRVFDCHTETVVWTAKGHGGGINDIALHPQRPSLVLTASRDTSLRLWNIKTQVCVAIMNGELSHSNEVLSIDFHPLNPDKFLSAGMDQTVKIWSLEGIGATVEASLTWVQGPTSFPTKHLAAPVFSSHKVHWNYVDCVRWLGNYVLSKSVDNRILLWQPVEEELGIAKGHVHFVQELLLEEADVWFIRFAMDPECSMLACGNRLGRVFVWDPHTLSPAPKARLRRPNSMLPPGPPSGKMVVRQTAVSHGGDVMLCCCDDGTIWRWDREKVDDVVNGHPLTRF